MAQHPHNEALFEQYKVTAAEMGISDLHAEDEFNAPKTLRLFIENHAEAIAAARKCYKEWRSWKGGRTKTEFAKEESRLKYLFEDAERAQVKTYEALQVAIMGEEAWLEVKRRAQEAEDEEFEAQIQADLDSTFA